MQCKKNEAVCELMLHEIYYSEFVFKSKPSKEMYKSFPPNFSKLIFLNLKKAKVTRGTYLYDG